MQSDPYFVRFKFLREVDHILDHMLDLQSR
jgi:hypothetical protein